MYLCNTKFTYLNLSWLHLWRDQHQKSWRPSQYHPPHGLTSSCVYTRIVCDCDSCSRSSNSCTRPGHCPSSSSSTSPSSRSPHPPPWSGSQIPEDLQNQTPISFFFQWTACASISRSDCSDVFYLSIWVLVPRICSTSENWVCERRLWTCSWIVSLDWCQSSYLLHTKTLLD